MASKPMCRLECGHSKESSRFKHPRSAEIQAALERENVHVMHHAGRIRVAVHGCNTREDIDKFYEFSASEGGEKLSADQRGTIAR